MESNKFQFLYRVEPQYIDGRFQKLNIVGYRIERETPAGYWIETCPKRWVPKDGKNLFAFRHPGNALDNFIKRKERQIKILKNQIRSADSQLQNALTYTQEWDGSIFKKYFN